jgi:hypothetical protein
MGKRATTDELFNNEYSEKGMLPSVGAQQTRNVDVVYKKNQTKIGERASERISGRVDGRATQANKLANDDLTQTRGVQTVPNYSKQAANDDKGSTNTIDRSLESRRQAATENRQRTYGRPSKIKRRKKGVASNVTTKKFNKVRARSVTMRIASPLGMFWLWFQLPFTILATILLGMRMAVDYVFTEKVTASDAGFLSTLADASYNLAILVAEGSADVLNQIIEYLFKIDLATFFDPMTYFFIVYGVTWPLLMMQLLIVYLVYKLALLEPLGGKGSGLKHSMLVLAMIGYSIPLLNMIPWVAFWILAIYKHPK